MCRRSGERSTRRGHILFRGADEGRDECGGGGIVCLVPEQVQDGARCKEDGGMAHVLDSDVSRLNYKSAHEIVQRLKK
jgi:hypothetical protein